MQIDLAVIGGTGVGARLAQLPGTRAAIRTDRGLLRGRIVELGGATVLAVQRHAAGHSTPPHKVNYAAVALGLAALGIRHCLATAAVGSLRREWPVGTIVACTDFIDASGRNLTLYDSRVAHTPMTAPFGGSSTILPTAIRAAGFETPDRAVYLQANGPRYETAAEIAAFGKAGADIVGMTAASEAVLMREAGIAYECLAVVTNFAAGLSDEIDHGAVGDAMAARAAVVFDVLGRAALLVKERAPR
ncbi:MAG: MTAP family purine nucleoside phosphorylase [Fimbriimonadaceae bacterium]